MCKQVQEHPHCHICSSPFSHSARRESKIHTPQSPAPMPVPAVASAPSTADVLRPLVRWPPSRESQTPPQPTPVLKRSSSSSQRLEAVFAAVCAGVLAVGTLNGDRAPSWHAPELSTWLETLGAFGTGCVLNGVLALITWRHQGAARVLPPWHIVATCGLLLSLPYTMPYRLGISASAHALISFIGVWKVLDVFAGTRPRAVRSRSSGS